MDYTKGEWETQLTADGSRIIYVENEHGGEVICRDVRHYNVPLIMAAPAMYEALNGLKADSCWVKLRQSTRLSIVEALSKAEGK